MPCLSFRDLSERLLQPPAAAPTLVYSDEKLINSEEEPCLVANLSLSSPTLHSDTILTDNVAEKEQKVTEIKSDPSSNPSVINHCVNSLSSTESVSPSTILQSTNIEKVTHTGVKSDEVSDGIKDVSNSEVMDEDNQWNSASNMIKKDVNVVEIVVEEMDTVKNPVDAKTDKVTEKRSDTVEVETNVLTGSDEPGKRSGEKPKSSQSYCLVLLVLVKKYRYSMTLYLSRVNLTQMTKPGGGWWYTTLKPTSPCTAGW